MICKSCSTANINSAIRCYSCLKLLCSPEEALSKLLDKQSFLESKFDLEFKELNSDILAVKNMVQNLDSSEKSTEIDGIETKENLFKDPVEVHRREEILPKEIEKPDLVKSIEVPLIKETLSEKEIVQEQIPSQKLEQKAVSANLDQPIASKAIVRPEKVKVFVPKKKKEPSVFVIKAKEYLTPIFDGVDLLQDTYNKYKREGKLPIFFMTIAGIAAILVGCGFLMQISFNSLGIYENIVKIGLGFAFSFVIGYIGLRLNKKDNKYREYSSALIGLTLILNYLFIYFLAGLSHFSFLSSAQFGFFLIVANTGLAIWMALKYETKIIAVLSLLGGALAPFYLNSSGNTDFYFGYLFVLLLASNYIALQIKWYKLNYISFVLFLVLVETTIFSGAPISTMFMVYIHLFAYLFFYIVLFNGLQLKEKLSKNDLGILAGNLSVFLINLHEALPNFLALGLVYLCNAILFSGILYVFWKTINQKIKVGLFITIGSFIGLAIPFLFGQELMGLFWAIEAILLICLGFVYRMSIIRQEGYLVLGIAIAKLSFHSLTIIDEWNKSVFHEGFLNFMVLGAVISGLWFLSIKFKSELNKFEITLFNICKELVPLWFSMVIFIISFNLIGEYALNLMWLFVFGLIYWSKRFETKSSETMGYLYIGFVVLGFGLSMASVNSPSFSDQTLSGKLSLIQLIVTFGIMRLFYEKVMKTKMAGYKLAYAFRVLFFVLIPLIFVKQVYKHIDDYFAMSLWLAMLMSYGLHRKFKHKALFLEFYFFVVIAGVVNIIDFSGLNIGIGVVTLVSLLFLERVEKDENLISSAHSMFLKVIPFISFGFISFAISELHWLDKQNSILLFSLLTGGFLLIRSLKLVQSSVNVGFAFGLIFGIIGSIVSIHPDPNYLSLLMSTMVFVLFLWNYRLTKKGEKGLNPLTINDNSILLIVLGLIVYIQFLLLSISLGMEKVFVLITIALLVFMDKKSNEKARVSKGLKNSFKYVNIIIFINLTVVLAIFKLISIPNAFLCYAVLQSVYLLIKNMALKMPFSKIEFNMAFVFGFIGIVTSSYFNTPMLYSVVASIVISLCLGFVLNEKKSAITYSNIAKSRHIFLYQILLLLVYISMVRVVGYTALSPVITIFLVIHAIILLFSSLKKQNKMLNKLSLIWFIMALIKVVSHDIRDFSGSMKIVVLIVLGILLLAASYAYVKIKEKYMPVTQTEDKLELKDEIELESNDDKEIKVSDNANEEDYDSID